MRAGTMGWTGGVAAFVGARTALECAPGPTIDACVDAAILMAAVLALAAWMLRRNAVAVSFVISIAVALAAFAWSGHQVARMHTDTVRVGDLREPMLVCMRVRLTGRFITRDRIDRDLLDAFIQDRVERPWTGEGEVIAIRNDDAWQDACGPIRLEIGREWSDLPEGAVVLVVGWLRGENHSTNPRRGHGGSAWRSRWIGTLRIEGRPQIETQPAPFDRVLRALRDRVDRNLLDCLGWDMPEAGRSLVIAMTTGRHLPGIDIEQARFQAAGLSHFLAISGFNVSVLFVMLRVLMESVGTPWRMRGWICMGAGVLFLCAVEVEVSVLRAGITGLLVGLASVLRRGWCPLGLLGVSAMVSLAIDPSQAANPGFQLSHGAVFGLLRGTTEIERCLGADGSMHAHGMLDRPVRLARTALAASLAAWLVSTPITLNFAGSTHPWCALTSTVLGPLVATITVLASVGAVMGWVPGAETVFLPTLGALVLSMQRAVELCSRLPGGNWHAGFVPGWWSVAGLLALAWWWRPRVSGRPARLWVACGMGGWLAVALLLADAGTHGASSAHASIEWVALDAGTGSAHLVRSDGTVTLVDGGSSSRRSLGSRSLLPAIRSLGVRSIDRVVIRGTTLDHFSGVPEVLQACTVRTLTLAPGWDRSWDERSPQAAFLACAHRAGVVVEHARPHETWSCGRLVWTLDVPKASHARPGVAVVTARIDDPHDGTRIAWIEGCETGSLARDASRLGLVHCTAIDWPPSGAAEGDRLELLAALRPKHVLQTRGDVPRNPIPFRNAAGPVPWGVVACDGALRLTAQQGRGCSLERLRGDRWIPVIR